ncbi:MAG TPA: ABC transporter substrate-binding protein [Stellaceae bacterium]|nr:ABC transporter substrate-binding protein [Stellaceae bacterium]
MHLQRKWIGAVAAAVVAVALAFPAAAQTVKIGVITTYSGPLAPPGISMDKGLTLYAKLHSKDLPKGVTVEIVRRDDTGIAPDVAKRLAQELITRDHVNIIAGVVYSPNALAMAPIMTEAKMPFVDMNAAAAVLTTKSPYIVRDSFTLQQISAPMGEWAAKHGLKSAYTAVSDYAPGWDAEDGFKIGITKGGGKVVGSVRFPVQNPDFTPFLQRIKDIKPKSLFIFVPGGPQSTQMMKTYNELGLKQAGITLVTTQDLLIDSELPRMGDIPLGVVSSGSYSVAATRPANKAFVAAWHKEFGANDIPDFPAVQGWDGMAMIFDVIKKTGGKFTGDQAMAILKNYKTTDSPRGPFMIDPLTGDIIQNIYIRRAEKVGGKIANVEFETFPMVKDPWKAMHAPAK